MNGDLGPASATAGRDVYDRLIADLDASGAHYRLIEHAPEGRTELVSALRGHVLARAAKCLILLASEDYLRLASPRIARIAAA